VTETPPLDKAPGLGAEAAVLPGDRAACIDGSGFSSPPLAPAAGFRIELIDDSRLESPASAAFGESASMFENDRFREGERNEAGDNDDWRSS